MSETPITRVTPDFVALINGMSSRTIERLIADNVLPRPSSKYRREWIGRAALTVLADALAKLPEPSARHASAIIEKIRGPEKARGAGDAPAAPKLLAELEEVG